MRNLEILRSRERSRDLDLETLPQQLAILGSCLTQACGGHRTTSRRIRPESFAFIWPESSIWDFESFDSFLPHLHMAWFGHISQPSLFTRNVNTTPWKDEWLKMTKWPLFKIVLDQLLSPFSGLLHQSLIRGGDKPDRKKWFFDENNTYQ